MEIELKFKIPDETVFTRLQTLKNLATYTLSTPQTKKIKDYYLDTPTRRILASGYALRRREVSEQIIMTLKGLGGVEGALHRREELEVNFSHQNIETLWSKSEVYNRVFSLTGPTTLQTLFALKQQRIVYPVEQENTVIAELSLDEVEVNINEAKQHYFELEVEQKPAGTAADLETIATYLQNHWGLEPITTSKFERGLALLGNQTTADLLLSPQEEALTHLINKPDWATFDLDDSMGEVAYKILTLHFQRLSAYEPGTRLGADIEALHKMRVATRRLRAAFVVFKDYLPRKKTKRFIKEFRTVARILGNVRDLDVFWGKIDQYIQHQATPPDLTLLHQAWLAKYKTERDTLLTYLQSENYQTLKQQFTHYLNNAPVYAGSQYNKKGKPIPHRLHHLIPIVIYQCLATIRAYDEWLTRGNISLTQLHKLRIDGKQMRYTLEFFADILDPTVKTILEPLNNLQDHLGDLQDLTISGQILTGLLTTGSWQLRPVSEMESIEIDEIDPQWRDVAQYLKTCQTESQQLLETFPSVWATINNTSFNQMIATLVSHL